MLTEALCSCHEAMQHLRQDVLACIVEVSHAWLVCARMPRECWVRRRGSRGLYRNVERQVEWPDTSWRFRWIARARVEMLCREGGRGGEMGKGWDDEALTNAAINRRRPQDRLELDSSRHRPQRPDVLVVHQETSPPK